MKKYIGKQLKHPYNVPQYIPVDNPDKEAIYEIGSRELARMCRLITNCNDLSELDELQQVLDMAQRLAEANARKPDMIEKLQWKGSLVREGIKCGKQECRCQKGKMHGPYWYCHTDRGPQSNRDLRVSQVHRIRKLERPKILEQQTEQGRGAQKMPGLDFKQIRMEIPIELVLDLLGWEPKFTRGSQLRGWCPIHSQAGSKSDAFSVNVDRDCFQCFKCHRAGNQLDLFRAVKGGSLYYATQRLLEQIGHDPPWIERW